MRHRPPNVEIVEKRLSKESDICLIVPTYRSADITLRTLRATLERCPDVHFDILLIDNGGHDHQAIEAALGSRINVVALATNSGGAGAFRLGQELALEAGYTTIVFSDNDAELLSENGLALLAERLSEEGTLAVCAHNAETGTIDRDRIAAFTPMIFFAVSREAVERVGLVDDRYFVQGEDLDYTLRLRTAGIDVVELHDCLYTHPLGKPSSFSNRSFYLIVRAKMLLHHGTLSRIGLRLKTWNALGLVAYLGARSLTALGDPRVYISLARGLRDGWTGRLDLDLPENRFLYREVPYEPGRRYREYQRSRNRIIPCRRYFQESALSGERAYFERQPLFRRER